LNTHQSLPRHCSLVYHGWWPYIWTPALNWYKIKLFLEYCSGFACCPTSVRQFDSP
jgi:hypothetical protein